MTSAPFNEENTPQTAAAVPDYTAGCWVTLIGAGGAGGNGDNSRGGGGGGGGGGRVNRLWIPIGSLGSTYTVVVGAGGATANAAGSASTFASGSISLSAGGGSGGATSSNGAGGAGGAGGTCSASGISATTYPGTIGGKGGDRNAGGHAPTAGTSDTTNDVGCGGGGGGGQASSATNGAAGGSSNLVSGGTGGTSGTPNGQSPASAGSGHGGAGAGGGYTNLSSVAGNGGTGGAYGGGGGGGAGINSATPGVFGPGGAGYTYVEWVAAEVGPIVGVLQRITAGIVGKAMSFEVRLQKAVFAAAGQTIYTGTFAHTLDAATTAMTGAQAQPGVAAAQLPAMGFAAAGAQTMFGPLTVTVRQPVAAATGLLIQTGELAATTQMATGKFEMPTGNLVAALIKATAATQADVVAVAGMEPVITKILAGLSGWMEPVGDMAATVTTVTATWAGWNRNLSVVAARMTRATAAAVGIEHPRGQLAARMQRRTAAFVAVKSTGGNIVAVKGRVRVAYMHGFLPVPGSNVIDFGASLTTQCEQTWFYTNQLARVEMSLRKDQPLIRYWNAQWELQFIGGVEYKASFTWISNDTGPGQCEIPFNTPLAQWIHDANGRVERGEGRNVCVTVDYCGARWSGLMDKYAVEQREDGDVVLVVDWMHDYEHLKWYAVWSNPFLPAIFQFPRAFLIAGPVDWALKMCLFLNVFREHNPLITWPDDPLNLGEWFNSLDMSQWHMVVAPTGFLQSMASGVVWAIPISRWATWHDMAHQMLEDAEMSVTCTRWLDGDPPAWNGATLRNGCLVIDLVDKSGVLTGTSHGGSIISGLVRTIIEFAEDFIDSTEVVLSDMDVPPDYFQGGTRYTKKQCPYVVYREGDNSPIQTSAWMNSPAKGVQVNVGGHSMTGVNELISATIQAVFDLAGGLLQIGSLGGSVDALLKPLYEDVLLAWWSVKNFSRAQHSGWERLFEYFQQGSNKAYTIASLMVLRAGFWATKTTISWKVQVIDGLPFMIGDRGIGHFFLDDRVGLVLKGDTNIHMDRCRKLELAWDENTPAEWAISIGDDRIYQDPAQKAWGKIEAMVAGLRDLGVW